MPIVGRLKEGNLLMAGNVSERTPVVQNGLIAHFPFDGRGGGFDPIGGNHTTPYIAQGLNLLEAMHLDWRDPKSWNTGGSGMTFDSVTDTMKVVGYQNAWLKTPIIIDPNKTYRISIDVMIESRTHSDGVQEGYLYVGGNSCNKAGTRVTANYDYTVASAYRPTLGQWVTLQLTRTGTAIMANGTSTSFSTVKGWTGDTGSAEPDKLIYYYYFGGLWNYNTGTAGVMYFRNPCIEIMDTDSSNTTITDEYIAVETATTNLNNKSQSGWNNSGTATWTWNDTSIRDIPYPEYPVYSMKKDTTGNSALEWGTTQTAPSTAYAFSTWFWQDRKGGGSVPYIRQYPANNNAGNLKWEGNDSTDWNTWPQRQWIRLYGTFTSAADASTATFCTYLNDAGDKVAFNGWQSEQKAYATSFTAGSRSYGSLSLPKEVLKSTGSIHFEVYPRTYSAQNPIYSTGIDGGFDLLMCSGPSSGGSNYWRMYSSTTASVQVTGYWFPKVNQWYSVTVTWVNNGNAYLYVNGVQVGSTVNCGDWYTYYTNNATKFCLGSGIRSTTSFLFRNVSFYNRVLTTDEITKLNNQSFQVLKSGDLIARKITEKPNGISNNAVYLPLDFNGNDRSDNIKPIAEINTVYENGSVWVGQAATNILLNPDVDHSSWAKGYNKNIVYTYDGPVDGRVVATFQNAGDSTSYWYCYSDMAPWADGTTYTVSLWVRSWDVPINISCYTADNNEPGRYWSEIITVKPEDGWKRVIWKPFTTPNPCDQDSLSFQWTGFTPGARMSISAPQAEASPFPTPSIIGTRNSTRLEYPPSLLNVNGGAIIGWWNFNEKARTWRGPGNNNDYAMLFATYEGAEQNKLNIRSHYSYPANTWYAQVRGPLSTDPTHQITFTASDGWHMVCLAWDKTNGKAKLLIDGNLVQELTGITAPSQYINSLKIGQWDSGVWGAVNQYTKDLVILNYYPSDAEIASMYKTQMRAYPDRLQLQGNVKDNQTL